VDIDMSTITLKRAPVVPRSPMGGEGGADLVRVLRMVLRDLQGVTPDSTGCVASPLSRPDRPTLCAGTDRFVEAMEVVQRDLAAGPEVLAQRSGHCVSIGGLALETRWPTFGVVCRARGLIGVHVKPLIAPGGAVIGTTTWYANHPERPGPLAGKVRADRGRGRTTDHPRRGVENPRADGHPARATAQRAGPRDAGRDVPPRPDRAAK
jgi:hypothetical protein